MLSTILYSYLRFSIAILYPAYKTWKALKRKDDTIKHRWMKYWVSFSAFQVFEAVADLTLAYILPFYTLLKIGILIWLVASTKVVFDAIVNRELVKREKSIDRLLVKLRAARNELLALLWFQVSRCSIILVTSVMSNSLSVLSCLMVEPNQKRPEAIEMDWSPMALQPSPTPPPTPSPITSERITRAGRRAMSESRPGK